MTWQVSGTMAIDPTASFGGDDRHLTGEACPRCGGALTRHTDADGSGADQHRTGHARTSEQLWIEQCARRNRALWAAARALAETANLAATLAKQASAIGNRGLAARLEEEAWAEARSRVQILDMLEEIGADDAAAVSES
jgi:hypothetical protein